MSFSSRVKEEIASSLPTAPCCMHAMTYGMLLFAREFDRSAISIMTEHRCVAETYRTLLEQAVHVTPAVQQSDAGNYTVSVEDGDIPAVLSCFSVSENAAIARVNRGNLLNERMGEEGLNCCHNAFFKGAFLSCGTISDPNKNYHLEFVVPFRTLSFDLLKLLTDAGINQTRHRILLVMRVDMSLFMPWRVVSTSVETEILISETVIVGDVPKSYLNWENTNGRFGKGIQ